MNKEKIANLITDGILLMTLVLAVVVGIFGIEKMRSVSVGESQPGEIEVSIDDFNNSTVQTEVTGGSEINGSYSYKNITNTNASSTAGVQVRGGAGILGHINVNRPATTTNIRVYDGLTSTSSATLIGTIYGISSVASTTPNTYTFETAFVYGLILDVPAGYAGDITVSYK
jgi:hypothetical protein